MKQFYKKRPLYTPQAKITTGLFTQGKQFMFADTYQEYIGLYHEYSNGAVYSGASFTDKSKQLIPYAVQITKSVLVDMSGKQLTQELFNNFEYFKLTETRFNNYHKPVYFYPKPTSSDYDNFSIDRFFVQKINDETNIIEISGKTFGTINIKNNPGIDGGLYKKLALKWMIGGLKKDQVFDLNMKSIKKGEEIIVNLRKYLTDLTEFYKAN